MLEFFAQRDTRLLRFAHTRACGTSPAPRDRRVPASAGSLSACRLSLSKPGRENRAHSEPVGGGIGAPKKIIYALFIVLVLSSGCANVQPLVGGPRDTTPPKIDSLQSTPGQQINFKDRSFRLTFDEWIELKDVQKEVLVSPPLKYAPKVELRGRTVHFKFDDREVLADNLTYTVNFGGAVRDLTEGNVPENLRFVFATGPQLDSMRVLTVVKSLHGAEAEGVTVALFDDLTDTALTRRRPLYFSKSNKNGVAEISYVKPGTYQLLAFVDDNKNNRYDAGVEAAAKSAKPVELSAANALLKERFTLSVEETGLRVTDKTFPAYGRVVLVLNREAPRLSLSTTGDNVTLHGFYADGDSVRIFYSTVNDVGFRLLLREGGQLSDSIPVKVPPRAESSTKPTLLDVRSIKQGKLKGLSGSTTEVLPHRPVTFVFDQPLMHIEPDNWRVFVDSALSVPVPAEVAINPARPWEVDLRAAWPAAPRCFVRVWPQAVQGLYGLSNDTISWELNVRSDKSLGEMQVTISGLDPGFDHIVDLVNNDGVVDTRILRAGQTVEMVEFVSLPPGNYWLRILEDLDGDGLFTPLSIADNRLPERLFYKKLEPLRPNWLLEAAYELAQMQDAGPTPSAKRKSK